MKYSQSTCELNKFLGSYIKANQKYVITFKTPLESKYTYIAIDGQIRYSLIKHEIERLMKLRGEYENKHL